MKLRRLPPLAIALALVAAALVATVLATRHAVNDAFATVGDGQAIAEDQAVRADLADLDGPPASSDLATIVAQHRDEGVRYLALIDRSANIIAEAGTPRGTFGPRARVTRVDRPRGGRDVVHVGDRLRVESPYGFRRSWGRDSRGMWLAIEVEPSQADELRAASDRAILIGVLAAVALFGVAIAVVRRELRRQAEDRARERERRLASLGEMSAVLAHEIKNPLASLKGNAQLLAGSLPAGDKPRAKAERVVDEAVRLEKLIQDLLAFVRTGTIERSAYDPAILARDAASTVQGEVVVEAGAVRMFQLDGPRIREVLVNLIDNAVAAGPPVRVRVAVEGDRLVYEISDHGPGVPAADRDKIFEPFHTGKTRGTGLGLAIAKRLVELHRGTIAVDDAPGGGARFRIALPEA
ncbi:MAG TPA: HAMP domain-containing sensor histidine kinase [Kofleriaceae bacterium]|nr:HAMP domain-containing sensor histidine kinase [Kofleriaceae bacterium]